MSKYVKHKPTGLNQRGTSTALQMVQDKKPFIWYIARCHNNHYSGIPSLYNTTKIVNISGFNSCLSNPSETHVSLLTSTRKRNVVNSSRCAQRNKNVDHQQDDATFIKSEQYSTSMYKQMLRKKSETLTFRYSVNTNYSQIRHCCLPLSRNDTLMNYKRSSPFQYEKEQPAHRATTSKLNGYQRLWHTIIPPLSKDNGSSTKLNNKLVNAVNDDDDNQYQPCCSNSRKKCNIEDKEALLVKNEEVHKLSTIETDLNHEHDFSRPEDIISCLDEDIVDGEESSNCNNSVNEFGEPCHVNSSAVLQPAFIYSQFTYIPPVINFVTEKERVEEMSSEVRKLLKWRLSSVTPLVVKSTVFRSGFRIAKKSDDWIGYFGKHMKASGFRSVKEYQKVNHFPGSFQIGRKDRLWRNLYKMQVNFGSKEFGFFPLTFCLPEDKKALKAYWNEYGHKKKWIIKPPASARGIGIHVINKWEQIPKHRPVVVQHYIHKPYLINESKFDLRIYVYVTSFDPLRIYMHEEGLVRFASTKYNNSARFLSNRYVHLTNYSVNKNNANYVYNDATNVHEGHKWSLTTLWNYLRQHDVDASIIVDKIKDIVIKTILAAESKINTQIKTFVRRQACVHELFGFDVLLDENLQPWILEVNISPSLHIDSPLDIAVKGVMIKDMLNLAGFQIPDKDDSNEDTTLISTSFRDYKPKNEFVADKRLYYCTPSRNERAKHAFFSQKHTNDAVLDTILDILTPTDVRVLCETVDEMNRAGRFQRLFPSVNSHRYLQFFEYPRYYNLLLDIFTQRYSNAEAKGTAMLEALCVKKIHLENPTLNPKHIWKPSN